MFWVIVLLISDSLHCRERRELYSRLMAKDLADYMACERREVPKGRNFVLKSQKKQQEGGG